MENPVNPLAVLDARRVALGLTVDRLAKRSGVSASTVERVLSGRYGSSSFETVQKIAAALGTELRIETLMPASSMRFEQALLRARQLLGEPAPSQSEEERNDKLEQMVHSLLSGSNRKLWAD